MSKRVHTNYMNTTHNRFISWLSQKKVN